MSALVVLFLSFVSSYAYAKLIIDDPEGDDINSRGGKVDVTSVFATTDGVTMNIRVEFSENTNIQKARGFIDLDTDLDFYTGSRSHANDLIPNTQQDLGVDFSVDVSGDFFQTGRVNIVNTVTRDVVGTASVVIIGQGIDITLPVALVSSYYRVNGYMYVGVMFANEILPTDAAPNRGHGFLLGPGRVTISPNTSFMITNQLFDIVLFIQLRKENINSFKVTLDGNDVTHYILERAIYGTFADEISIRIPGIKAGDLTQSDGFTQHHTIFVEIQTPKGMFKDGVVYTIAPSCEDCILPFQP